MKKEKELTIEQYHAKKERQEKTGKVFCWIIAIVTMVAVIGNFLTDEKSALNTIVLTATFVASIMLLCGFSWSRVFLAILSGWNLVWGLFAVLVRFPYGIFAGKSISSGETIVLIFSVIDFLWYLFTTIVLFKHEGVKEYMYGARNG